MNLNSKQKMELYRKIESNLSLGFMEAISIFDKVLAEKKKEFETTLSAMGAEIQRLKLKDGYSPRKYVDYFTKQEIEEISGVILRYATPKKGEHYMTAADVKSMCKAVMGGITLPKDGKTPQPGKDYPTISQVKQMIVEIFSNKKPELKENGVASLEKNLVEMIKDQFSKVEINGEEIVTAINGLPIKPQFQIDWSHIKNAPRMKKEKKGIARMGRGTGSPVMSFDLSSQLDGVTKTFTIPTNLRVIAVHTGGSTPTTLRPTVDYTNTTTSITFTSQINASTTLAAGQTLIIVYAEA